MKNSQKMKKCADVIVDFLVEKKIDTVFDLSGGMIAYLEDAISRKNGINCYPMHHEQAAGFAAEGYARQTQNFGVAIATSGPGALNLVTPIGSCFFDSVPAMFITGNVNSKNIRKTEGIRQEGFQETDIVSVVKPITKYSTIILDPNKLIYELEKAHFLMKDRRPGSVLIDIPINIQYSEVDIDKVEHFVNSKEHIELSLNKIDIEEDIKKKIIELKALIDSSKAPVILAGNGVRVAGVIDELRDFVTNNNIPVVTSLLGIDVFGYNENLVGYIGSNGNRDANIILANADLIIALGARLDVRQTGGKESFNNDAILVHVDIDRDVIDYSIKSSISICSDLVTFFSLVKNISTEPKQKWLSFIKSIKEEFKREDKYSNGEIDPNTFIKELSYNTPKGSVIVSDVGQNQIWCAQSWVVKQDQRLLFSGGMGSMGFSLPVAIGAAASSPTSSIMSINGDGGFQMNMQEMETIRRNNIPLKVFVLNNKSLGMVREFQDLYLDGNHQSTVVGFGCPDLRKIANAFGFDFERIEKISEDDEVLKNIIKSKDPTLIEVVISESSILEPKVVFGHKLDDQMPYLEGNKKEKLNELKALLKD